jgi:hypothetical protein
VYGIKVVFNFAELGVISPTEHFTDLGKLNFPMVVWFKAQANFNTAPATSKNNAWFKWGQNQLKNKQLASLI